MYEFDNDMSKFCQDVNKSIFRQIGPKFKASPDLLKSLHSRNVEDVECKSSIDILRYFMQNLYLDKLVLKLKSRRIYLKFSLRVNIWKYL